MNQATGVYHVWQRHLGLSRNLCFLCLRKNNVSHTQGVGSLGAKQLFRDKLVPISAPGADCRCSSWKVKQPLEYVLQLPTLPLAVPCPAPQPLGEGGSSHCRWNKGFSAPPRLRQLCYGMFQGRGPVSDVEALFCHWYLARQTLVCCRNGNRLGSICFSGAWWLGKPGQIEKPVGKPQPRCFQ